jgi:hypothetical protein
MDGHGDPLGSDAVALLLCDDGLASGVDESVVGRIIVGTGIITFNFFVYGAKIVGGGVIVELGLVAASLDGGKSVALRVLQIVDPGHFHRLVLFHIEDGPGD